MNEEQHEQIDSLVEESIKGGMAEDLIYESREQAQEALDHLKDSVNEMTVDDIYFED